MTSVESIAAGAEHVRAVVEALAAEHTSTGAERKIRRLRRKELEGHEHLRPMLERLEASAATDIVAEPGVEPQARRQSSAGPSRSQQGSAPGRLHGRHGLQSITRARGRAT